MGILARLLGSVPLMRLDIFMSYDPLSGSGAAAVELVPLESDEMRFLPLLVALLYGRTLRNHRETRAKLFGLIDALSKQNLRDEGRTGFSFPEWTLEVGHGAPPQRIWPWVLCERSSDVLLKRAKVYRATLEGHRGKPDCFSIHLKMALGQERILAPAASLIAISSFAESTDQAGRYDLAGFLWVLNEVYGSPEGVNRMPEHAALSSGLAAMRSGKLRDDQGDGATVSFTFPDGTQFVGVGESRGDAFYGQGTVTSPDGTEYVGEIQDGRRHGQGTLTLPNGDKYVGEFKNGMPDGQGTFTTPIGAKYVGEYRDGWKEGQGTATWPDGREYVGELRHDEQHGFGTMTFPDGHKYVGQLRNGMPDGQGILTYPDGNVEDGLWRKGKFVG